MMMTEAELQARKDWYRQHREEAIALAREAAAEDNDVFRVLPTASADPDLTWSAFNFGPVYATYQWHRAGFYDDPE
jgi:hypothetical protein